MKKIKLTIALLAAAFTISAGAMTSMAASYKSPAGVVAELTGKSVEEAVREGTLSQEEADDILASMKAHQQTCDGSGYGYGHTASCGSGYGRGHGYGHRSGYGHRGGHCRY